MTNKHKLSGRERIEIQFNNAKGFSWLNTPREVEVYKMGLQDALALMEHK